MNDVDDAPIYDDAPPQDGAEPIAAEARSGQGDPVFAYLIALALAIGLTPLIPLNADLRYTLAWGLLALIGVGAWLLASGPRIEGETLENLAWGIGFGLLVGTPILLVGGETLTTTARLLFTTGIVGQPALLPAGAVISFAVFTQPLAETLFFRGVMQNRYSFWLVGGLSSVWSLLLFLPMMEIGRFPVVAVIIGIALVLVNVIYSYVRQRNGLAAAWLCQIVVNGIIVVLPYFGS